MTSRPFSRPFYLSAWKVNSANFVMTEFSKVVHDTDRSSHHEQGPRPPNNLSVMRSGYPDGVLALGMCGAERTQSLPGLIEAIGVLDGNPEGAGLQHPTQAL